MLSRNSFAISTYSPRRILLASFAGTGGSPSPSVNGDISPLVAFFVVAWLPAGFTGSHCLESLASPEFAAVADLEALESPPEELGNFKAAIKPESGSFLSLANSVEINNATFS